MSGSPPKIDPRTYAEIVDQTVQLAQYYTSWVKSTPRALRDRTLAQNIANIAQAGTVIDESLGTNISENHQGLVKVEGWNFQSSQPDAGAALVQIFARMAALVSDRLNQSPDKNFLAFLNLIGTQIQPPRPARVPLTFTLATGSTGALVPAYTQVAATPQAGETEEVVFETERDLAITAAQLQAVWIRQPETDKYGDCTQLATGEEDGAFTVFAGERLIEHSLYLACDELFTLSGFKTTTLTINSSNVKGLLALPITWSYWDGSVWKPCLGIIEGLTVVVESAQNQVRVLPGKAVNGQGQIIDLTQEFPLNLSGQNNQNVVIVISHVADSAPSIQAVDPTSTSYPAHNYIRLAHLHIDDQGDISQQLPAPGTSSSSQTITFNNLPDQKQVSVNGVEAAWLKGQLQQTAVSPGEQVPNINQITTSVNVNRSNITPDLCFFNTSAIDLSKDFYPFGEQPRFNDTFYLASRDVFAEANTTVTVEVTLTDGMPVKTDGGAEILWEAWDGQTWQVAKQNSAGVSAANLNQTGTNTFDLTVPANMEPHTVNGSSNYWIRARLVKGNYGTPATTNRQTVNNQTTYEYVEASFQPPSVKSLKLSYTYQSGDRNLSACLTYNDFAYTDCTGSTFNPFTPTTDTRPAIYLGFNQPFANELTTLYGQTDSPLPGEVATRQAVTEAAQVVWEYAAGSGNWKLLGAEDETQGFSERGTIRFIGPVDWVAASEFGQSLYWLRARWSAGQFPIPPRLRRLMTNTTWATQATTITSEILGSSNGNPDQEFVTSQSPILPGQHLQVRESDIPPDSEAAVINKQGGEDAITVIRDETGQPLEVWVRWQEVIDFYGSGPRDRHYVLDRLTGKITFGNNRYGMAPPAGRNNIRMAVYRTGGGEQGDRAAETITELKTTLPYVDSVTNLEPASGGADRESLERVKERGPKALRHRQRAVTAQDIEDLAFDASADVARALAITPHFATKGLNWLPQYYFQVEQPGDIQITVKITDPGGPQTLQIRLHGPAQTIPYREYTFTGNQDSPPSSPQLTYTVSAETMALGQQWSVTLVNQGSDLVDGQITIGHSGQSFTRDFSDLSSSPHSNITDAGQVTFMIVPYSEARQPTPSMGLINRVETYLKARCAASIANLEVTEPDWVEVTVTTTIVPTSLEVADQTRVDAQQALTRFLHPLTGGVHKRGWDFGRHPHDSDLYALLESIPGVDHVESLTIVSKSAMDGSTVTALSERQLIFSGTHQVSLVT